jgi:hypothetical protein
MVVDTGNPVNINPVTPLSAMLRAYNSHQSSGGVFKMLISFLAVYT